MTEENIQQPRMTGWHFLFWLCGLFGVMFAVNGVFLFHAINSFPGEDVPKSYLQGLRFNDSLAAREAQNALGWRAEMGAEDGQLLVRLSRRDGSPLTGQTVLGELRHGATTSKDTFLVFVSQGGGVYAAQIDTLQMGRWNAVATVIDEETGGTVFAARKTLVLK